MTDTIYALASAPGRAGVAVVRVSGPEALQSLKILTGDSKISFRYAHLRTLVESVSRETIDKCLILPFKSPHSYTGEDVVEYHIHGGPAVIQSLLEVLARQKGHRLAELGEFTRRAFENGKMDLTEAEAVADLIHAETQLQKQQALAQMDGALANLYDGWRDTLVRILAHVEADLEFPDEDLPHGLIAEILPQIRAVKDSIDSHLNDNRRGERLRSGVQVAVIGAPNAGKSSLINALTQRDVAIVSEVAGTTRDVIEVHLDLGGYPVILSDTAGLRENVGEVGHDAIEREGMRRAVRRAEEADLRVLLYDGTKEALDAHTAVFEGENAIVVVNKADLGVRLKLSDAIEISAKDNQGIDVLVQRLIERISGLIGAREQPALTRARHRQALEDCRGALDRVGAAKLPELAAEDLRLAARHLGRITGRVDVEELLDVIFRDFCIGK